MSHFTLFQDTATGHWLVQNSRQVTAFEPEDEIGALQTIVYLISPQTAALARQLVKIYSHLEDFPIRAWRAAYLVTKGAVTFQKKDIYGRVATVKSQHGRARYSIQERECLVCNCVDYQFELAPVKDPHQDTEQKLCKHVIAYSIALKLTRHPPGVLLQPFSS